MTATQFSVSDDSTRKLWSDRAIYDITSNKTLVGQLIGQGTLIRKDEVNRGPGDRVRYAFLNRISSKGLIGEQAATGNEKALVYYNDDLLIDQLRQVVQIPNKGTISQQRVSFALEDDSYEVLRNWMIERMTVSVLNQLAGYAPTTITYDGETFTGNERMELWGMNTPTDPAGTGRIIRANSLGTDALVNADTTATFKFTLIDAAEKSAEKNRPYITPLTLGNGVKYRCYVHIDQFYQLIQDTSAPIQYRDIFLNMIASGKDAMIGRSIVYSQTEIIATDKIPYGVSSSTAQTNTRRAVFVGREAGAIGFGQGYTNLKGESTPGMSFRQDDIDVQQWLRISCNNVWGCKKTVFNSIDHGVIVIVTYVA